jgi:uncharacterized membrane-anchored protein YitT (DUF2179 family)
MDLAKTGTIKDFHSNEIYCRAAYISPKQHIRSIHVALRASYRDLLFIVSGCIVFIIGMKALMIPHQLIGGGLAGIVLLFHYILPSADLGHLYFLLNLPLIWLGWSRIGKRFLVLTIFGMVFFSIASELIEIPEIIIHDRLMATLFTSIICGLGSGLIFHSRGSAGGFDVLSIILNCKTGFSVANLSLALNAMPLVAGVWFNDMDTIFYSCLFHITCSRVVKIVMDYPLSRSTKDHLR